MQILRRQCCLSHCWSQVKSAHKEKRIKDDIFHKLFSVNTLPVSCLHSDSSIDLFSTFIHFHTIFALLKVNSSDPIQSDTIQESVLQSAKVYGNVKSAWTRHSKLGSTQQWIQSKWTSWGQGRMEVVTKWSPSGHHRLKHDCYPSCPYFTPPFLISPRLFLIFINFLSHFYPLFLIYIQLFSCHPHFPPSLPYLKSASACRAAISY